jgi:hypothetical protein
MSSDAKEAIELDLSLLTVAILFRYNSRDNFFVYLLYELIVFEHLPALHDPDDGGLQVHFPILLDGMVSLFDLLRCFSLNASSNPELCPLVRVLCVQADH